MKLTYTRKTTFNINATTIYYALAIPLCKKLTKLNGLSDEIHGIVIKTYDQFCLLIIDKISLVDNRILTFIDCRLSIKKQVHNHYEKLRPSKSHCLVTKFKE
jgi:hypothetical protein